MELQPGDWVETESGEVGKVVHISRLTVFVAFEIPGKADLVQAYLESQLTMIERPDEMP
jgi:preprotein translocase subunit YajC